MRQPPQLDPVTWTLGDLVACNVLHITALICTLFRLCYRGYRRELWWEDAWAALALVGDACCLALAWALWEHNISGFVGRYMFMTWLASCMWNNVVWWSRMSILCSFIRITHTKSPQRRAAYVSAVFFVLMWLALFARQMYLCKYRHCIADQTASLMQIITGVFADIPLIVLPVWLLRGSSLPRNRRMLVYAVFFSSMVITVLVIFHGVYDMGPFNEMVVLGAHVLAALSLIICNLFVIVTCIVRLIYCGDGSEADNSQLLTTVLEAALAVETSAPHVLDLRFSGATPELSGGPDDIAGKNLDDCKSTVEQK